MNQLIERIAKLPDAQKAVAAVLVYALLFAVFHFLIYSGRVSKLEALRADFAKLEAERNSVAEKAENRDKFEQEVADLNERLAVAQKELPNESEIPELLRRVSSQGKKVGLDFLLFQPLPEVPKNFYAEVPVRITVQGSYHDVALFFDRVGKLNRIVNIADIKMTDPKENSGRILLKTDGKVVTYRFLDKPTEGDAPKKEGKKKKEAPKEDGKEGGGE